MNNRQELKKFLLENKPKEIKISTHAIDRYRERSISDTKLSMEEVESHLKALYELAIPDSLEDFPPTRYRYNGWVLIVRDGLLKTVIRK